MVSMLYLEVIVIQAVRLVRLAERPIGGVQPKILLRFPLQFGIGIPVLTKLGHISITIARVMDFQFVV